MLEKFEKGFLKIIQNEQDLAALFQIKGELDFCYEQLQQKLEQEIKEAQKVVVVSEKLKEIRKIQESKENHQMPPIAGIAPITGSVLSDLFTLIERNDASVSALILNARDYADFRKFSRDVMDLESNAILLKNGIRATLWGAFVIVDKKQPSGKVLALSDSYAGVSYSAELLIPERINPSNISEPLEKVNGVDNSPESLEKVSSVGLSTNVSQDPSLWVKNGCCPKCGESGKLDSGGGATCSTHGFYQMQIM